ncbi:MAG TPA: hypothetical protein VF017_08520 [Thermoanaerobaculia bacterium]|nr:hypothetical protein [Thermoanaerobaculia bacterium]
MFAASRRITRLSLAATLSLVLATGPAALAAPTLAGAGDGVEGFLASFWARLGELVTWALPGPEAPRSPDKPGCEMDPYGNPICSSSSPTPAPGVEAPGRQGGRVEAREG